MDSTLLSKIETGKRRPTAPQLAALAGFYSVDVAPLESLRLVEEIRERYGDSPQLAAAGAILHEEARGGYPVKKLGKAAHKAAGAVKKEKKKP
jgi:transcriptional regulator with XRE-family HTH domain